MGFTKKDRFAPKAAISPKVGLGALDDGHHYSRSDAKFFDRSYNKTCLGH